MPDSVWEETAQQTLQAQESEKILQHHHQVGRRHDQFVVMGTLGSENVSFVHVLYVYEWQQDESVMVHQKDTMAMYHIDSITYTITTTVVQQSVVSYQVSQYQ